MYDRPTAEIGSEMDTSINTDRLGLVVLAWLWCQRGKPVKEAAIATAMKTALGDASFKQSIPAVLDRLVAAGDVERIAPATKKGKSEFKIAAQGESRAADFLGRRELPAGAKPFAALGAGALPAIALGVAIPGEDKKSQAAFGKLAPVAVCARRFMLEIPLDQGPDAAKVALVKLALAKWNGVPAGKIHLKLKKAPAGELPALVVGPLLEINATAATNLDKLIDSIAAGILNAGKPSAAQIKAAVLRRWVSDESASKAEPTVDSARMKAEAPAIAPTQSAPPAQAKNRIDDPPADSTPAHAPASVSPHPSHHAETPGQTFEQKVHLAAKAVVSTDRRGLNNLGDQALIHYCWREYQRLFGAIPICRTCF
jgi:hypothetical protein